MAELRNDYDVILCDPPWRYDFARDHHDDPEQHYPTMSVDELKAMRGFLNGLHNGKAILFMWTTAPQLKVGIDVLLAWGFEFKSCDIWVKVKRDKHRDQLTLSDDLGPIETDYYGLGYYTRVRHELILIGTVGKFSPPEESRRLVSAFYAEVGRHSAKPDISYKRIEAMYPDARRVELFARSRREGWDAWGNEV